VSHKLPYACYLALFLLAILEACTTIPVDERNQIRDEVNQVAETTIAQMIENDPTIQKSLDKAVGYAVASISATKIPVLGGGYGLALLHDTEQDTRTYINVSRFDLGAGVGSGRFRVLVIFEDREVMEKFRDGTWHSTAGAESAVGTQTGSRVASSRDGYSLHYASDTGVAFAATARLIKTSINEDLTGTGVSEISFPNMGFESIGEQGEDAPRVWDHQLPFLAQKVIDQGYDLPLPYGIGLTYADVDQLQLLEELQVGINGSEIIPFDFVSFENARSLSNSYSLKADAWILPFMNVYIMLGRLDGHAEIDIDLDGNGMLEHLDITCEGFPPSPLCPLLEDKTFTLPLIKASFDGTTYGAWATFAAGWKGWFVAVPVNFTYADMSDSDTDGINYTVTPRFGKTLNLGRNGNLSLFAGGNYLDSDLTIDGTAETPDGLLSFDYIIDQQNKDKWNALIGFNWDINKSLSWSAEYNGFIGSRDAFITSVNWRF
jgi:lipid-binding SYLF domain-containing protein